LQIEKENIQEARSNIVSMEKKRIAIERRNAKER
jgi:hypothetical protein